MVLLPSCSSDLEQLSVKCTLHFLPKEFTLILITAVYNPPQAKKKATLSDFYKDLNHSETSHPDIVLIVAVDFNQANFKVMPDFHQHINCTTREIRTLDHCYTAFGNGNRAEFLFLLGRSNHTAILSRSKYANKLQ